MCIRDRPKATTASTVASKPALAFAFIRYSFRLPVGRFAFRAMVGTVSYTHLDVYKRQINVRMSAMASTPYQASDDSQAFTWVSRALR